MKTSDITQGQINQIDELAKIAADQASREYLNKDTAQQVIINGNNLKVGIKELIKEIASQETHLQTVSVEEQLKILHKFFPKVETANLEIAQQPLPRGATEWFVVPQLKLLDKDLDYQAALEKVMHALNRKYRGTFNNEIDSKSSYTLYHTDRTDEMISLLSDSQKTFDCLVFPGQIGFRHFDLSRDQYEKRYYKNEFGLGSLEVGCLLLTHGVSLFCKGKSDIICPGDDFHRYIDMTLWFCKDGRPGEKLCLDEIETDIVFENGSSTGFLPNGIKPT